MISTISKVAFALLFLIPIHVLSQKGADDFYSGYIVTNEGDTLRGQVLKAKQYINPESISFKYNESEEQYSAKDIRAFYISEVDVLFESHQISKNQNSNQKEPVTEEHNGEVETGRYFVFTLAKTDSYGVYSHIDKDGTSRLYFRSGDKLEELLIFRTYLYQGGKRFIRKNDRYKVQLLSLLIDCPAVKSKIESTSYSSRAMIALLKAYASCKGDKLTYEPKKKRRKVNFGLMAGYGTVVRGDPSRTVDAGEINRTIATSELDRGNWFEMGLAIQIESQRDERFTYRGELKLRTRSVITNFSGIRETNRVAEATYDFKNTHLLLHFLMNFNIAKWEKGKFFVAGGAYAGSSLTGRIESEQGIGLLNGDLRYEEETLDIVVQQTELGASIGLGVQLDKLVASIRYNTSLADEGSDRRAIILSVAAVTFNLSLTPW